MLELDQYFFFFLMCELRGAGIEGVLSFPQFYFAFKCGDFLEARFVAEDDFHMIFALGFS